MKWHGFQSGPLLSWPFSRAAVDSTLGGSGRFEALCKNCVLEDDGICVCAQAFDMIHVTRLSLGLSLMLTDCAEHQLICNINKGNAQNINSPLVPFSSHLTLELMKVRLWCLAWMEEIESVHLLVPEGCVVVRIRDEKGDRIDATARQTCAKRYFPALKTSAAGLFLCPPFPLYLHLNHGLGYALFCRL